MNAQAVMSVRSSQYAVIRVYKTHVRSSRVSKERSSSRERSLVHSTPAVQNVFGLHGRRWYGQQI